MPPLIKFERLRNRLCDAPSSRAECGEWGLLPLCLGLRAGDPPAEAEPLRKAEGRVLDMVMIVGIGAWLLWSLRCLGHGDARGNGFSGALGCLASYQGCSYLMVSSDSFEDGDAVGPVLLHDATFVLRPVIPTSKSLLASLVLWRSWTQFGWGFELPLLHSYLMGDEDGDAVGPALLHWLLGVWGFGPWPRVFLSHPVAASMLEEEDGDAVGPALLRHHHEHGLGRVGVWESAAFLLFLYF